jgi:hypothetical protein
VENDLVDCERSIKRVDEQVNGIQHLEAEN